MKTAAKTKSPKGRQGTVETHSPDAASTPAITQTEPMAALPGSPTLAAVIEDIRMRHRERRFAMGIQQVLDRKLESFIRIYKTDWRPGDSEEKREKANKEVAAKIKAARAGQGDTSIYVLVTMTDEARRPADKERARCEEFMEELAAQLPVADWVRSVPGLGLPGLATIIAETGDLSRYSNVSKVWKRLGYHTVKGLAPSTMKREKWRGDLPALTKEEWIENPFSGKRYALIHTISIWLKNKQWIGAKKTDDGVGKPNGRYGEIYAKRRAKTALTHPDWSKKHSHMDGLRIMMKAAIKDLFFEWNPEKKLIAQYENGRQSGLKTQNHRATGTQDIEAGLTNPRNGRRLHTANHSMDAAVAGGRRARAKRLPASTSA